MVRATPLRSGHVSADMYIVALVVGAGERARIQEALRGRYTLRFVDTVSRLEATLDAHAEQIAALIVESHDADRRPSCDTVRFVRSARPQLTVVGYCRAGIAYSDDIRALAAAGVHELLFRGIDDVGSALRAVLAQAQQASAGEIVAAAFVPLVPERLWLFVRHVTRHPVESQRVGDVAHALGCHRKTLVNHCAQALLPPPQEMLAWCRLGVVGYLLSSSQSTVEAIALQLDFPSDTALRNLVKRHVGIRATEVRALGGLKRVVAAFESAVAANRRSRETG